MGDRQDRNERDFFISYTAGRPGLGRVDGLGTGSRRLHHPAASLGHAPRDRVRPRDGPGRPNHPPHLAGAVTRLPASEMAEAEWRPGLVADPSGTQRRLMPVRVEECEPKGLLADRVWSTWSAGRGRRPSHARSRQSPAALRGHGPPDHRPRFPTASRGGGGERPRFPTALPPVWNVPLPPQSRLHRPTRGLRAGRGADQGEHGGGHPGPPGWGWGRQDRRRGRVRLPPPDRFDTVWWVRAEEPTTLVGDYAELAIALGLPEAARPTSS